MNGVPHSLLFVAAISLLLGSLVGGMILPVSAQEGGGAWDSFTQELSDSFSTIGGGIAFVVTVPLPGGLVGTGANSIAECFDDEGAGGVAKGTLHGIGFFCNLPKDGLGWIINSGIGIFYGSCTDKDAPLYPLCGGDCQAGFYCTNTGETCECVHGPTTPGGGSSIGTPGGGTGSPTVACVDATFPRFDQVADDLRASGYNVSEFYPPGTTQSEGDEAVLDAWCGLHICDSSKDFCDSTAQCVHEYNTDVKCNCVNQDGSSCGPGEGPDDVVPPVSPGPVTPGGGPGPNTPSPGPGPTTPTGGSGPTTPGGGGGGGTGWQSPICVDAKWDSPYSIDDEVEKWLESQGQDPSQWHAGPGIVNLVDLFNVLCSTKQCSPLTGVSCAAQPTCVAMSNLKGCECTPGTDCGGPGVTPGNGPTTPTGPTTPPGTGPTTPGGGGGPSGPITGYSYGGACAGSSTSSTSTIYSTMEAAGVDMSSFASSGSFDQAAMKDAYCAAKTCPSSDSSCNASCVNNSDKEVCECVGGSCGGDSSQGGCEFPDFPDDAGNCVDVTPTPDPGCEFPVPFNGGYYCATTTEPAPVEPGCTYPDPTDASVCLDDYFNDDGCDPAVQDCHTTPSNDGSVDSGNTDSGPGDSDTGGDGSITPTHGNGSVDSGNAEAGESPLGDFWEKFTHLLGLD